MSDMVEVVIDSIRVSLMSQQRIVILREKNTERYLPIWIGVYEAESITIALQEVEVARPLTHDLLTNVFQQLDARDYPGGSHRACAMIPSSEISWLRKMDNLLNIDSRPSDALAIAVRAHVPILVARSVMDSAASSLKKTCKKSLPSSWTSAARGEPEKKAKIDCRFSRIFWKVWIWTKRRRQRTKRKTKSIRFRFQNSLPGNAWLSVWRPRFFIYGKYHGHHSTISRESIHRPADRAPQPGSRRGCARSRTDQSRSVL